MVLRKGERVTPFPFCRTHQLVAMNDTACAAAKGWDNRACEIVRLVWSADGSALLVVEECGFVLEGTGLATCPECDGSGWRYTADTTPPIAGNYNTGEIEQPPLAVVPLADSK